MKLNNKNYKKIEEVAETTTEENIEEEKESEVVEEFNQQTGVVVNCTSLYVRMRPHSNATPISTIDRGTKIDIIEEEGDFWNVKLSDGTEGFCMKKFIKIV